jgi:hypothetical protein
VTTVRDQYAMHDLDRHRGDGAPRNLSEERELDAREHVRHRGAAALENALAGEAHVRGVDRVARKLERVVGLDGRADVGVAAVEQRPTAVGILDAAQVGAELRFEHPVERVARVVREEDVLGGDRRVGFELEDPVTVGLLPREKSPGRRRDGVVETILRGCVLRQADRHSARYGSRDGGL